MLPCENCNMINNSSLRQNFSDPPQPRFRIKGLAGPADLDLDAHWMTVRQNELDFALFPSCAEITDDQHPMQYRFLSQIMADFRDSFGRQPYARSDGIVRPESSRSF